MRLWPPALALASLGIAIACSSGGDDDETPPPSPPPELDAATTTDAALEAGADADAAMSACGTDVSIDPKNCGRCGHDCLGGACAAGACRPILIASDQGTPLVVATTASHVYWINEDGHAINRAPLRGGAIELVFDLRFKERVGALGFDGARVFSSSVTVGGMLPPDPSMYSVLEKDGGARVDYDPRDGFVPQITAIFPPSFALAAGAIVRSEDQLLQRTPLGADAGPTRQYRLATKGNVSSITIVGDTIYYATETGEVASAPVADVDAGSTMLATGQNLPRFLTLHGGELVWLDLDTSTIKTMPPGGKPSVFVGGLSTPRGLAVDDSGIYWTEAGAGVVRTCPRTGCGSGPRTLASAQGDPSGITLDAENVYWTNATGGTVVRVAK